MNLNQVICTKSPLGDDEDVWEAAFGYLKNRVGGALTTTGTCPARIAIHLPVNLLQHPTTVTRIRDLAQWKEGIAAQLKFENVTFFDEMYPVIGHCFESLLNDPKVAWKGLSGRNACHSQLYPLLVQALGADSDLPNMGSDSEDEFGTGW